MPCPVNVTVRRFGERPAIVVLVPVVFSKKTNGKRGSSSPTFGLICRLILNPGWLSLDNGYRPYRPSVYATPAQLLSFELAYLNQLFFRKPPKWKQR